MTVAIYGIKNCDTMKKAFTWLDTHNVAYDFHDYKKAGVTFLDLVPADRVQGGLFDGWVAGCPLSLTSPNAPSKRDILGTVMLSVLAGHRRYAHITTLRCDPVNPPLLGMKKVVSEDAVRRALSKIEAEAGRAWLQEQLDYCTRPLLRARGAPGSLGICCSGDLAGGRGCDHWAALPGPGRL